MAGNMQAGQGPGTELCKYCWCSGVQVALQYSRHGGEGEASPGVWVCCMGMGMGMGQGPEPGPRPGTGYWVLGTGGLETRY